MYDTLFFRGSANNMTSHSFQRTNCAQKTGKTTNKQQSANCCFWSTEVLQVLPSPSPSSCSPPALFPSKGFPMIPVGQTSTGQHQRMSQPLATTSSFHRVWWNLSSSIPGSFITPQWSFPTITMSPLFGLKFTLN